MDANGFAAMVSRVLSLCVSQCIDTWNHSARFGSNQTLSSLSFTIVGSSLVAWCYRKTKTNNMKTNTLIQELINLAGEAIHLADQYSGGESETVAELSEQLEELIEHADEENK